MFKTVLTIEGMMCGKCEAHVNEAVRRNLKVKSVKASHDDGTCEIISKEKPEEDKIRAIIDETGYQLKGITTEEFEKKGLFG